MSEASNPRVQVGDNVPPLDGPDRVAARLSAEHAALFLKASNLEADSFKLPEQPKDDAELALVTDHIVEVKRVAKQLEDARTETGRPYLDAGRAINTLFNDYRDQLVEKKTGLVDKLQERVEIYTNAKEARERAEREAAAREQRRIAEVAQAEERRLRDEADAAAKAADAAAAAQRQAKTNEERAAAQAEQQRQETLAAAARKGAEGAEKEAGKAERQADVHERIAGAEGGALSRVSTAGSSASVTKEWTHAIIDAAALMASLGPLGAYLSNDTISQAIARAVRERAAAGSAASLAIPGVRVFEQPKVNVRAARS